MHSLLKWILLGLVVAALGYIVVTLWQLRGPLAAGSMIVFTVLLSWVASKARKRADSIEY